MNKPHLIRAWIPSVVVLCLSIAAAPANAVSTQSCADVNPDVTGKVTVDGRGTLPCELFDPLLTSQSNPTVTEINEAGFFDLKTWSETGVYEFDDAQTAVDITLSTDSTRLSGSFTLSNLLIGRSYFLAVKDGAADPDSFVAYLLGGSLTGMLTGTYMSPFFNCDQNGENCGSAMAISNFRLYEATGFPSVVSGVPVPAPILLLVTALAGLGCLGYRRRQHS